MMEKNANELIMLNESLLKRLGQTQKDGKIILSGDVVHRNGKVIIKLHQLRQINSDDAENGLPDELIDKDQPYQIFLREENLTEIPDVEANKENIMRSEK